VPVDLVIDHSVQVDFFGSPEAQAKNVAMEFPTERRAYELLRWGQKASKNSASCRLGGNCSPGESEFLAKCVFLREDAPGRSPCPTRWSAPTATRR